SAPDRRLEGKNPRRETRAADLRHSAETEQEGPGRNSQTYSEGHPAHLCRHDGRCDESSTASQNSGQEEGGPAAGSGIPETGVAHREVEARRAARSCTLRRPAAALSRPALG